MFETLIFCVNGPLFALHILVFWAQSVFNSFCLMYRSVMSDDEQPTVIPMEEIVSLQPGHTVKRVVQVHFHHHLLPLKLALTCNGEKHPIKLWPDIGYFVKPLPMDIQGFTDRESALRGMFEYARRLEHRTYVLSKRS